MSCIYIGAILDEIKNQMQYIIHYIPTVLSQKETEVHIAAGSSLQKIKNREHYKRRQS